jgi:hypothetical protein
MTMAEEDLPVTVFGSSKDQTLPSRKWMCPGDYTLAAYADCALGKIRKRWLESHLASCQRCRLVIADVIKSQRKPDLAFPPFEVRRKAIDAIDPVPQRSVPWTRVWASTGALAGIGLVATFLVVFHKTEQLIVLEPPAPAAPLIAKSERPASTFRPPVHNTVRKPSTAEPIITMLSPQPGTVVTGGPLRFSWKPISQSRNYEVRVVRRDGDLVWESGTQDSAIAVPSAVELGEGSYFVWITAYLEDGRVIKSAPVRFRVKR